MGNAFDSDSDCIESGSLSGLLEPVVVLAKFQQFENLKKEVKEFVQQFANVELQTSPIRSDKFASICSALAIDTSNIFFKMTFFDIDRETYSVKCSLTRPFSFKLHNFYNTNDSCSVSLLSYYSRSTYNTFTHYLSVTEDFVELQFLEENLNVTFALGEKGVLRFVSSSSNHPPNVNDSNLSKNQQKVQIKDLHEFFREELLCDDFNDMLPSTCDSIECDMNSFEIASGFRIPSCVKFNVNHQVSILHRIPLIITTVTLYTREHALKLKIDTSCQVISEELCVHFDFKQPFDGVHICTKYVPIYSCLCFVFTSSSSRSGSSSGVRMQQKHENNFLLLNNFVPVKSTIPHLILQSIDNFNTSNEIITPVKNALRNSVLYCSVECNISRHYISKCSPVQVYFSVNLKNGKFELNTMNLVRKNNAVMPAKFECGMELNYVKEPMFTLMLNKETGEFYSSEIIFFKGHSILQFIQNFNFELINEKYEAYLKATSIKTISIQFNIETETLMFIAKYQEQDSKERKEVEMTFDMYQLQGSVKWNYFVPLVHNRLDFRHSKFTNVTVDCCNYKF